MIANFFNKTKPATIFILVALLFVYYFTATFLLHSAELSINFLIKRISFFVFIALMLMIVNFIVKKNKLTKDNSYALLLIVILFGTFPEAMFSYKIVLANIALLLGFRKIYSLRSGVDTKLKLFDASFWIAIATIFYSWSIFFVLLVYLGMIIHQKITVKNLFIPIVGFVTPMLIYFTYCLYFEDAEFFYNRFNYELNLDLDSYTSLKLLIPLLFLSLALLWSLLKVTPKVVSVRNNFKFSWDVLINHLLISAVIVVLAPTKNGSELLFFIFPAAVIVANLMHHIKSKIFKNAILYAFLLISVFVYFL
ncbi:MAG: hypothetical protein IBX66_02440 [Lutibacter sp.]|nr:hypothetical protein [Lutibacter sp.]